MVIVQQERETLPSNELKSGANFFLRFQNGSNVTACTVRKGRCIMKKTTAMVVTVVAAVLAIVCSVLMCTLSTEGTIWGVCMLVCFVAMVVGLMNRLLVQK